MSTLKVDTISPKTSWSSLEIAGNTLNPVTSGSFTFTSHWSSGTALPANIDNTATHTGYYSLIGNICHITCPYVDAEGTDWTLFYYTGLPYVAAHRTAFAIGDSRGVSGKYNTTVIGAGTHTESGRLNAYIVNDQTTIYLLYDSIPRDASSWYPYFDHGSGSGYRMGDISGSYIIA